MTSPWRSASTLVRAVVDPATGGVTTSIRPPGSVSRHSPAWPVLARLRTTIIAAGSTVSESDLLALRDPLDALMRSTLWGKLVELWVPVGNTVAGALCKIKGTTLAMTGNGLVDADYTRWLGVSGNGTSKDITTNFNAAALTASWGMAVYPTGPNIVSGGHMLAGDGSSTYLGFGNGDCKINGSSTMNLNPVQRMLAIQNQTGVGASSYYGGYQFLSTTAGATNAGAIRLMSYAGAFYSDIPIGGFAAWSPVLTASEMLMLSRFFDDCSYLLGRSGVQPMLVCAGDSNTIGVGLGSPTTTRWAALLAADIGAVELNSGVSGSGISSAIGGAGAHWVDQYQVSKTNSNGTLLTCMFGTNDDRYLVPMSQYASDYETWLNYQFSMGWQPGDVVIISPIAATDVLSSSTRQQAMRNACLALAAKYGTMYVDGYATTVGQPTYFQVDSLHLSTVGHAALKTAVLSVIAATRYSGNYRV